MIDLLIAPISSLLERFIPDADTKQKLAHDIATMAHKQAHAEVMAQLEVNKAEAAHKSLFVAGWRPGCGWVCVLSLGFNFIGVPLMNYGLSLSGSEIEPPPPLDLEVMLPILLGMLGLGGMRSYEKRSGVAREK